MPEPWFPRDALGGAARLVHASMATTPHYAWPLLPGNRYDAAGVAPHIQGPVFETLRADSAYDSSWRLDEMNARGALICMSQCPQELWLKSGDAA